MKKNTQTSKKSWLVWYTLASVIFSLLLAYLVSRAKAKGHPGLEYTPEQEQLNMVLGTFYGGMFTSIALLFLLGVGQFRSGFKRAYIFVAVGIGLLAFVSTLIPMAYATGWWDSLLIEYLYPLPVWSAPLLMLAGLASVARIVGVKILVGMRYLAIVGFVVVAVLALFVKNFERSVSLIGSYDLIGSRMLLYVVTLTIYFALLAPTARAARRLHGNVSVNYARALAWFYVGIGAEAVAAACTVLPFAVGGAFKELKLAEIVLRFSAIVLLMKSAHAFYQIDED